MYVELFNLTELPFRLTPDPEFLYLSKAHARAKAYMESTVWFADGFVVITGEIGCGKTTLVETFLQEVPPEVLVTRINQTQVSSTEFLQTLLVQFGVRPFRMKKAQLLSTLNDYMLEQYNAGRKILLVVDEAQNLTQRVLEEVRLLSGIETTKDKVLRIILAGQPELNYKLDAPELEQLSQRIRLRFHLPPLSPPETQAYVAHRLEVAGAQGREIFAPDTFELIYRFTGGVPRLINTLCDTSMLAASNHERDTVQLEDVRAALTELQWDEYTARTAARLMRPTIETAHQGASSNGAASASAAAGAGDNAEPLARLLLVTRGQTLSEHALHPGRLIIGRTPANDLQIDSRFVSRHHCQVVTTARMCVIEDLNSTNGIFLQDTRIRRHMLSDGDVVTIGEHVLLYIDERGTEPRADNEVRAGSTTVLNDHTLETSS